MDTQTMSYEEEMGMGKTATSARVIQERKEDGRVFRREEFLLFGKIVPREELPRGMEQLTYFYTDEGFTAVFSTREKIRAVRAPGGLPKSTIPEDATFSGREGTVDGRACWVVRLEGEEEVGRRIYEYTVDKESYVIRAKKTFNEGRRLLMSCKRKNFSFAPQIPQNCFQIPHLDEIFHVKDRGAVGGGNEKASRFHNRILQSVSPAGQPLLGLSQLWTN